MQQLRALLPLILGLATSRTLNISLGYSNYTQTDAGIITDGSTLIRCALFVLLAILIIKHNWHFSDRTNTYLLRVCMITTPLCVLASFFINPALNDSFFSVLIACILSLPSSLFALMWLTFAKKLNAHDIALFVIVGGMASEIFIYGVSLLPLTLSLGVLLALCALQPVLIKLHQSSQTQCEDNDDQAGYLDALTDLMSSKTSLLVSLIGIAALAAVIGLLRGFPEGLPIAFTPPTRIGYVVISLGFCTLALVCACRHVKGLYSSGIWFVLQGLAILTLILYVAFPDHLEYGAMVVTALNSLAIFLKYYISVRFMHNGARDPLFYAILVYLAFMLPRAIARVLLYINIPWISLTPETLAMIMSGLVLLSAQLVFWARLHYQSINEHRHNTMQSPAPEQETLIERIVDLDASKTLSDVRKQAMGRDIAAMGKQFLLSDREVEVLTLFALGHTHANVADALCISTGTVHSHMKRIYAKTGMHSRRDILDYLRTYSLDNR